MSAVHWWPNRRDQKLLHSIDAHFHDGVIYISCTVLVKQAAITLYMYYFHNVTLRLPKTQDWKLFPLCCCSFSAWGRERVAIVFTPKGSQYLWMFGTNRKLDYQGSKTKHHDTPLMLIDMIGQGACRYSVCVWRQPLAHIWMFATNRQVDYPHSTPKMIDAPLPLIFRIGLGAFCYCFWLWSQEIPHLWMSATNHHIRLPKMQSQ